ncbi:MAG TPA: tyrosine-type recombinase/integrase [Dermatophilaceae bacterium]|jgi:hypothetical protein
MEVHHAGDRPDDPGLQPTIGMLDDQGVEAVLAIEHVDDPAVVRQDANPHKAQSRSRPDDLRRSRYIAWWERWAQAGHHAAHCSGAPGFGGLPGPAHHWAAETATGHRQPDRQTRRLRMVARIAKAAGIPRHISPHSLRHAAITNALDAGVPLRDAQILARHADPRTTQHYDRARGNLDRHGVHFLTAYVAGV